MCGHYRYTFQPSIYMIRYVFQQQIISPVKLWEDPGQIDTQINFAFLTSLNPYYKHTKSRMKTENMKLDFFHCLSFELL